MYYYAYLDENDICTSIYEMPAQISGDQYVEIPSNYPYLIGQHFNRETGEFEVIYYYAVLNEKSIVTETVYYSTQQQESATLRAITYSQYKEIEGLYWNGTEYVTPPISIAAVASTDEVNYKNQDKWLSTKLDEMDASISENETDIGTITTSLETVVSNLATVTQSLSALSTVVDGKANAVHTHGVSDVTGLSTTLDGLSTDISGIETAINGKANAVHTHSISDITELNDSLTDIDGEITALQTSVSGKANDTHTHAAADLSGVVKTVNGNAPDESGNIVVTSGGMTADEILTAIKTVDGENSGLDADTLDGIHASGFATANHNHDGDYAAVNHTHTGYASTEDLEDYATTASVNTALAGKSDTTHNHDADYAALNHTHNNYLTSSDLADYATTASVNTALSGKADTTHNHDTVYAALSHSHTIEGVTGLATALAEKAAMTHTHDTAYAPISHSHSIDGITGLATTLAGKADADHTHSGYATTASVETVEDALDGKADSTHNHDAVYAGINHTHTGYAATDHTHSGYAAVDHTHSGYATSESVSAIENSLDNKANANHTHSIDDVTGLSNALSGKADSSHTHSEYAAANHTHSGYAATNHTHSGYASSSHNHSTLSGAVNITGAIKSNGVQVGYNSGSDTTLGSNSYPTNVAGTYVTLNGEKTYAPNIYPRNTGTFYLGAQSNRWSGIYSKVAVNVSSDERLKENIKDVDTNACAEFVNAIDVKNFNFIGSEEEQIGIIAQQLVSANPDFAKYFVEVGDDGYYGVKTSDLVFPLIAAVQELYKLIRK